MCICTVYLNLILLHKWLAISTLITLLYEYTADCGNIKQESRQKTGFIFNAKLSCIDHKHICLSQGTQIRQSHTRGCLINLSLAVMNDLSWYSDAASSILLPAEWGKIEPSLSFKQAVVTYHHPTPPDNQ